MQRAGRDVGRFLGGATLGMVSDPKYGMRTLMGAPPVVYQQLHQVDLMIW